jgi:hypothetical protein
MFLQLSSSFTPLKMQDPELVNQLKERLPEALFEKLNGSLSIDRDRLRFAEYKVRVLEERLRLVRIEKYGPRKGRRNAILGAGIASFLACGSRSTSSSLC